MTIAVTEEQVREAAAEVFTPDGVELWMDARNRMLDGRSPHELIAAGKGQRTLDLIDFLASGSFA